MAYTNRLIKQTLNRIKILQKNNYYTFCQINDENNIIYNIKIKIKKKHKIVWHKLVDQSNIHQNDPNLHPKIFHILNVFLNNTIKKIQNFIT